MTEKVIGYLFWISIAVIVGFCFYWCNCEIRPLADINYNLSSLDSNEKTQLIVSISRLEGMVLTMQRMVPVYGGLIIAVILFLTWKQQNIAKATAIEEINDNFGSYKERIIELEDQAKDLTEKIRVKYEGICQLTEQKVSLDDLIGKIGKKGGN